MSKKSPARKGAQRVADVPADVLAALNAGERETANLVESLAIDPSILAQHVLPQLNLQNLLTTLLPQLQGPPRLTMMQSARLIGRELAQCLTPSSSRRSRWHRLRSHPSDTVRGWGALAIGAHPLLSLADKFAAARPFAADRHFGVREMAWLGVREALLADVESSIEILQPWTMEADENLRRFASEATRPCGVWCAHSPRLKATPELGLPLLEPLRADASRYVRLSVGNWLNDAGKSQPDWVRMLCERWSRESPTQETAEILRRGLRSLQPEPVTRR